MPPMGSVSNRVGIGNRLDHASPSRSRHPPGVDDVVGCA
jgi:hypothetical protein